MEKRWHPDDLKPGETYRGVQWRRGESGPEWFNSAEEQWEQWYPGSTLLPPRSMRPKPQKPAAVMDSTASGVTLIIGGVLILLGSFLPWATVRSGFGQISRSGMEGGDGILTLGLAIVVLVAGLGAVASFATPLDRIPWASPMAALITFLIAGWNYSDIQERFADVNSPYAVGEIGAGIWTLILGAAVAGFGAVQLFRSRPATPDQSEWPEGVPMHPPRPHI